jgi:hypothetical protein
MKKTLNHYKNNENQKKLKPKQIMKTKKTGTVQKNEIIKKNAT